MYFLFQKHLAESTPGCLLMRLYLRQYLQGLFSPVWLLLRGAEWERARGWSRRDVRLVRLLDRRVASLEVARRPVSRVGGFGRVVGLVGGRSSSRGERRVPAAGLGFVGGRSSSLSLLGRLRVPSAADLRSARRSCSLFASWCRAWIRRQADRRPSRRSGGVVLVVALVGGCSTFRPSDWMASRPRRSVVVPLVVRVLAAGLGSSAGRYVVPLVARKASRLASIASVADRCSARRIGWRRVPGGRSLARAISRPDACWAAYSVAAMMLTARISGRRRSWSTFTRAAPMVSAWDGRGGREFKGRALRACCM